MIARHLGIAAVCGAAMFAPSTRGAGGQAVNQIFADASSHVDPSFEFAPFQDYVNTHIQDELSASLGGNGTLADAFDRVQDAIVAYATDQGYTVV